MNRPKNPEPELTSRQVRALYLLGQGWELGKGSADPWVQEGGLGKGGTSETIGGATLDGLLRLELIEEAGRNTSGVTSYRLTLRGMEVCRTL